MWKMNFKVEELEQKEQFTCIPRSVFTVYIDAHRYATHTETHTYKADC